MLHVQSLVAPITMREKMLWFIRIYLFKPITILLGSSKPRMQQQHACEIMLVGTCFGGTFELK